MQGLLYAAFAPYLVNTFTRRVSVSVRIMVNRRDKVRFMVRVRGYKSVISMKLFFRLGLGIGLDWSAILLAVSTSSEK